MNISHQIMRSIQQFIDFFKKTNLNKLSQFIPICLVVLIQNLTELTTFPTFSEFLLHCEFRGKLLLIKPNLLNLIYCCFFRGVKYGYGRTKYY